METSLQPGRILEQLDQLWASLGAQHGAEASAGVLRACAMTLIVAVQAPEDDLGETLAALMRDHPARALVLRYAPAAGGSLDARVLAQCWKPFGARQQICSERVEISVPEARLDAAAPLVGALAAADLPVVFWCRAAHLLDLAGFRPVLELANKVIVDSAPAGDPASQLRRIRAAAGPNRVVADLAWTRLTPARVLVAQLFDDPAALARIPRIARLRIGCGRQSPPLSAYYMAGWLQQSLGRAVEVEFRHSAPRPPALEAAALEVSTDGALARGDHELLAEELSLMGRDTVFETVLERVSALV